MRATNTKRSLRFEQIIVLLMDEGYNYETEQLAEALTL
jgi:hypothetical protein